MSAADGKTERKRPSFKPLVPYSLKWEAFGSEPCRFGVQIKGGKPELQTMTFIELVRFLCKQKITGYENRPLCLDVAVSFDGTEHIAEGEIVMELLPTILELVLKKANIDFTTWYFYDKYWGRGGGGEFFTFFLVSGNEIVLDHMTISSGLLSRVNSDVLKYEYDDEFSDADSDQAIAIWWYRKFYSETKTGQILEIKNDVIYGGLETGFRSPEELVLRQLLAESKRINVLLMFVLVAIVAIAALIFGGR